MSGKISAPIMPFSPLDAILDALPALRKAGKVRPEDNVLTVQQRMADVLRPIVKQIQEQAATEQNRLLAEQLDGVRDLVKLWRESAHNAREQVERLEKALTRISRMWCQHDNDFREQCAACIARAVLVAKEQE